MPDRRPGADRMLSRIVPASRPRGAAAADPRRPFWTRSPVEALEDVGGSPTGLSTAEAVARLRRHGPNELKPPPRFEALRGIARYLANPLVLILLVASGASAALGQVPSSVVIALMLVLSVALNVTQAYRSQSAARRLQRQVAHAATVVRDGAVREVPARTPPTSSCWRSGWARRSRQAATLRRGPGRRLRSARHRADSRWDGGATVGRSCPSRVSRRHAPPATCSPGAWHPRCTHRPRPTHAR